MVSDRALLGTAAVFSIALIECVALMMGIDGVVLTASVSAIVGIITFLYAKDKYSNKK